MAVAITVDLAALTAEKQQAHITVTGLTVGTRYDVVRVRMERRFDSTGAPVYERILPDKKALWSAVAHRVGWAAKATSHQFDDYETPLVPVRYFIVESSKIGPHEWDWRQGAYPLTNGVFAPGVVDLLFLDTLARTGLLRLRSVAYPAEYQDVCVVEMGDIKYTARGTELQVMGNQYPVYVADTREARRGTVVLKCDGVAEVNQIRDIVFPASGAVWPIIFNAASDPPLILNDMVAVPLDITIEQATTSDASLRYVHVDFVEIDPTAALMLRNANANDAYVQHPKASFTVSDSTPAVNQRIVLTDTSTGQFDRWHWFTPKARVGMVANPPTPGLSAPAEAFWSRGPHEIFYRSPGRYEIKLWVGDSTPETSAGASVVRKFIDVHR